VRDQLSVSGKSSFDLISRWQSAHEPLKKTSEYFCRLGTPLMIWEKMCSGGGPVITLETRWFVKYHCNNCANMFKAIGKNPTCPSCFSEDVVKHSD
jgi:hypothetical protein